MRVGLFAATMTLGTFLLAAPLATAQEAPTLPPPTAPTTGPSGLSLEAPAQVRAGGAFIVSAQTATPGTYGWEFGDGATGNGSVATHAYEEPGQYLLTLTFTPVATEGARVVATQEIVAYTRAGLLFTSQVDRAQERELQTLAEQEGVALSLVLIGGHTPLLLQQSLQEELASRQEQLAEADLLLFATPADTTLNALIGLGDGPTARAFAGKTIVLLSDARAATHERLARITSGQLGTERIVLTHRRGAETLLRAGDAPDVLAALEQGEVPAAAFDRRSPGPPAWALLSRFVDQLLQLRVPAQTVLLVLLMPVILCLLVFMRQVVGISIMGLYVPVTLTLAYAFLGLRIGLVLTIVIIGLGILVRWALRRLRLLYLGRVGLATSIIALLLLAVMFPVALFAPASLAALSVFPLLVLILITERTFSVIAERGLKPALLVFFETVLVAVIATVVTSEWEWLRGTLFAWPELLLVVLAIQFAISRYTGLRATEIIRFRDLLNEVEYAEEE